MPGTDLILLHPPHVYDFRKIPQLYEPVSDLAHSTPVFEMYPVGFTSIAEYLEKHGSRVRIINIAWRMLRDARFDAAKFISKLNAPVFGIDLHWMVHAHGSIEIARLVKKHHPGSKVIIGGFSASRFYKELIEYPEVDFVMRGDSTEEPLRQFMAALKTGDYSSVPNLVWEDSGGKVCDNGLTYVPTDISHVMGNHYGLMVRQVLRYRDLASVVPFKGWLKYPVTAVFTCRGCTRNCLFCGGSASAMKVIAGRSSTVFRTPDDIHKDIINISRISRGLISILGDIRQPGEEYALQLLEKLKVKPVKNRLMFELYEPAAESFVERLSRAAPGFSVDISPHSHDGSIRQRLGINYTNTDMEETIRTSLAYGAGGVEVFFMIGLPGQDESSVHDTVEYCATLLKRFGGDKRLSLFIGPLGPFLDPGSIAFENPCRHGYRLLFKTFEEYRQALIQPSWKHTLNYETLWLDRNSLMNATYTALERLTRLKQSYGQIPAALADAQLKRISKARSLEARLDELLEIKDSEGLKQLKLELDRINGFGSIQDWQLKQPVGAFSLRFFNSFIEAFRQRK